MPETPVVERSSWGFVNGDAPLKSPPRQRCSGWKESADSEPEDGQWRTYAPAAGTYYIVVRPQHHIGTLHVVLPLYQLLCRGPAWF